MIFLINYEMITFYIVQPNLITLNTVVPLTDIISCFPPE